MNEKITQLWNKAAVSTAYFPSGQNNSWETQVNFINQFAELIVRETLLQMAIQMDKFGDNQANNPAWYKSEEAVKQHFDIKYE